MPPRRCAILACVVCVLVTAPVAAGLYNPQEPDEDLLAPTPASIDKFRLNINRLLSIGLDKVEVDNPLRMRYLLLDQMARKARTEGFSLKQKISLSATFLRRREFGEAVQLLEPLARQEPDNILVLANLALAYQRMGELERASAYGQQMLKAWPEQWSDLPEGQRRFLESIGWAQWEYERLRKVEVYHVKLLRARLREKLQNKNQALKDETVDPLFANDKGPVRFVSEDGKYEPGRIAAAEKAKLPSDATDILQQLLVWMPYDNRLYWQLGEIYNGHGKPDDLRAADKLFDDLVDPQKRRYQPRELVEHYRLVKDRVATLPPPSEARLPNFEKQLQQMQDKEDAAVPFDWNTLLVGFGAGFALALFGLWQLREIRRRRQARQAARS